MDKRNNSLFFFFLPLLPIQSRRAQVRNYLTSLKLLFLIWSNYFQDTDPNFIRLWTNSCLFEWKQRWAPGVWRMLLWKPNPFWVLSAGISVELLANSLEYNNVIFVKKGTDTNNTFFSFLLFIASIPCFGVILGRELFSPLIVFLRQILSSLLWMCHYEREGFIQL